MVCFYFYHPGGAPRFSWFSCVFIWWYFWCILMCSCVLFLVRFSRVFCRAFSGVFWWFCWWYFLCFSWCFFHFVLVLFSVLFFVLVPFLFYIRFPLVVVLFFCRAFFRGFWVFFPCFFSCFLWCFFCVFYRAFFRAFFRSFSRMFFRVFFFRALGGTRDKRPQYFAFWPVLFSVLFLVVTTSEDRIYTIYNVRIGQTKNISIIFYHFFPYTPKFNISPEKWWERKTILSYWVSLTFQGLLLLNFGGGVSFHHFMSTFPCRPPKVSQHCWWIQLHSKLLILGCQVRLKQSNLGTWKDNFLHKKTQNIYKTLTTWKEDHVM